MRVLIAFDKFKDSLTARQACDIAARVIRHKHPGWSLDLCPLADGGEGFCEILTRAAQGEFLPVKAMGPRQGLADASIGLVGMDQLPPDIPAHLGLPAGAGRLAIIEMAQASGLALLPPDKRDPWSCTTYGTGQLIRAAAESGARAVLLGVGGSATHDLGLGALSALGFEFRGPNEEKIRPPTPETWFRIERIEGECFPSIPPIRIACDVTNPLLGPHGAAAVYAPQKGLRPEDFDRLEAETERLAHLLCDFAGCPRSTTSLPGTGAAGGIAFGLLVAAKAKLAPGFDLITRWLRLDERVSQADLVITGEGRFDQSSLSGKGPGSIVRKALALGKQVHVFAGAVGPMENTFQAGGQPGEPRFCGITPDDCPIDQALAQAPRFLAQAIQSGL